MTQHTDQPQSSDEPYALASDTERHARSARLHEPHIVPLTGLVEKLREEADSNYQIPYFDPCDGGVEARVLILMEAPGPRAIRSGFVSRNNPDQTAKNLCLLLSEASLPRKDVVIWNVVPWYIGDGIRMRTAKRSDLVEAKTALEDLLIALPNLEAIVLMGRKAQEAFDLMPSVETFVVRTLHPSPQVLNIRRERRDEILSSLRQLANHLNSQG